ncbi:MAG: radical SAM protein [Deltaproteobacteria bacterium]|nr:radical SAM protein [Deltaproteobacteria bacterium]
MRILVTYPPLVGKGSPMLTQNRQFQWMHRPSYLFPCVPASAATYLRSLGHDTGWLDGITERLDPAGYLARLEAFRPDLVAMETKTPVVGQHEAWIDRIRARIPGVRTVLFGDHAAALPDACMERSRADAVLTGGDYDFSLASLVSHLETGSALGSGIVLKAPDGTWTSTGPYRPEGDLEALPFIDRRLTRAHLYFEKWLKRVPFLWTMAGRDCPWGRCTFCSWTTLYPKFRVVGPERLLSEMESLVQEHGAREIFDDTGCLPGGAWLEHLCEGMIAHHMAERILFDCNFRFDGFTERNVGLMKRAGFRKIIVGIESASQRTLDVLHKRLTPEQVLEGARLAASAGLELQLTLMVGFPWETREDVLQTLGLARRLLNRGWAHHLQATVVVPYPGTPLYDLCRRNGWLRVGAEAYERYDMAEPVCDPIDMDAEEVVRMAARCYRLLLHPRFVGHTLLRIRRLEDLDYISRGVRAIWSHIRDFSQIRS